MATSMIVRAATRSYFHPGVKKAKETICRHWILDRCTYGDYCRFLHSWFQSKDSSFSMLTRLEGHKKAITGIALPAGSNKLYSGARDGTVMVWDCNTGKYCRVANLGSEVGCLISEQSWVFTGLPNLFKAWNISCGKEICLQGPVGQVYAMVARDNLLFAGAQDGAIAVWKYNLVKEAINCNPFEFVTFLVGHRKPVVSLFVGQNRLYSGSMDGSIRVWNEELRCVEILKGHSDAVLSILCWNNCLISCSLNCTVHVWAANEKGNMKVIHTHKEEEGIVAMFGMGHGWTSPSPVELMSLTYR